MTIHLVKGKTFFLTCFALLLIKINSNGQEIKVKDSTFHTRNFIFTTPVSKNTRINGLALGLMALPWNGADTLLINGINIELEPLGLFIFPFIIFGGLEAPFHKDSLIEGGAFSNYNFFADSIEDHNEKINGLSISGGGFIGYGEMNGVSVNGLLGKSNQMNGLEVTGLMNLHYDFNGVLIAGLRNKNN